MSEEAARALRVVVEHGDHTTGLAQMAALEQAGHTATFCGGPAELPGGMCPAVDGTGCSLLMDADVVVHHLDLDEPRNREVLTRLRASYPDLGIVIEASEDSARRHADALKGTTHVTPFDMQQLVAAVERAAAERD